MEEDFVKRFLTKDGKQRISIYQQTDAENPRYMTDEPLHCEDWSRNYSIMTKQERESKSSSATNLLRYFIYKYGRRDAIIGILKTNGKSDTHYEDENALIYDKSRKEWVLYTWVRAWKDYQGEVHEAHWSEEISFCCKVNDLYLYDMTDYLTDETVDTICSLNLFTDGIKMCSYGFGYNGEVSFSDEISCYSEGIAWLEKDEFLKYSGLKDEEKVWKDKSLKDIEWLLEEIEAWGDNEVYGFVVEKAIRVQVMKTYFDGEREDESYIETNWEEEESCWGFYGELDKSLDWILEDAGFKKEDLTEE